MAKTYKVNEDGRAPAGLYEGDEVVTGGGTYKITGVNQDGTYKSEKVSNVSTKTYTGNYDAPGATPTNVQNYNTETGGLSNDSPGYIIGGRTYYDAYGNNPVNDYSVVNTAGGRYIKTPNGSMPFDQFMQQELLNARKNTINLDEIMNAINAQIGPEPSPDNRYYDFANSLAQSFINMDYNDWLNSDQYGALADRYGRQGKMNMQDVLGQISSRTGGLASSYATTAANQQYNEYMAQLEDIARQAYDKERANVYENVQTAYDMSDRDYQRYLDQLANYGNNRSYAYQVLSDALANSRYDQEWQNTLQRQAIEDQRYNDETAYGRGQTAQADARNRIGDFLSTGGRIADLDQALITASGYTQPELAALESYYDGQNFGNATSTGGTSRRTSSSSSSSSGSDNYDPGKINEGKVQTYYQEGLNRLNNGATRRSLYDWLNGIDSKELSDAEINALVNWLNLDLNIDERGRWIERV